MVWCVRTKLEAFRNNNGVTIHPVLIYERKSPHFSHRYRLGCLCLHPYQYLQPPWRARSHLLLSVTIPASPVSQTSFNQVLTKPTKRWSSWTKIITEICDLGTKRWNNRNIWHFMTIVILSRCCKKLIIYWYFKLNYNVSKKSHYFVTFMIVWLKIKSWTFKICFFFFFLQKYQHFFLFWFYKNKSRICEKKVEFVGKKSQIFIHFWFTINKFWF